MPQIFRGSFSSKLEKIWAQIRQGAFDYNCRQEMSDRSDIRHDLYYREGTFNEYLCINEKNIRHRRKNYNQQWQDQ